MHWIALRWPSEGATSLPREALAWWALRFTPRVAWVDEALLLEVADCERLWGGRRALLQRLGRTQPADVRPCVAQAPASLFALARLRLQTREHAAARLPASAMPLPTLSAARPHLGVLERLGCHTWGQADALPRAGLTRRFGTELGRALDVALGRAPDIHSWATLPKRFVQALDLPHRADSAGALIWTARRLLAMLQQWLQAHTLGVLALELSWAFDQLRLDGRELPPVQSLVLRTAEPTQGMAHLQRLLFERLERTTMLAPARALRLRVLQTAPWQPDTASLLPDDRPHGDPLHVFIERVTARIGPEGVRAASPRSDQRLECRQSWQPAERLLPQRRKRHASALNAGVYPDPRWPLALAPTWVLRPPHALGLQAGAPCRDGRRLHLVSGPHRIESGWWSAAVDDRVGPDDVPVARDYFIARDAAAHWLLVYCERPTGASTGKTVRARWFLQGIYA